MLDQQKSNMLAIDHVSEHARESLPLVLVQTSGRFVQEKNARAGGKRTPDLDKSCESGRKAGRWPVRNSFEPEERNDLIHSI
jgi:hypothetical protein